MTPQMSQIHPLVGPANHNMASQQTQQPRTPLRNRAFPVDDFCTPVHSIQRSVQRRRPMSERQAYKELVNFVSLSAKRRDHSVPTNDRPDFPDTSGDIPNSEVGSSVLILEQWHHKHTRRLAVSQVSLNKSRSAYVVPRGSKIVCYVCEGHCRRTMIESHAIRYMHGLLHPAFR